MNFAERLDELMAEKKMNSLRLSKEIGGSDRVIGAWRKGEYEPKLESLIRLADFFDVSLDYLAGRSGNEYKKRARTGNFRERARSS